jgi:hypothetical protein
VPGYLTAKSDELIKKKGAIAFGVYGIESNDRESKLTNPVQRTKGSDRVIAKTLVAADGERWAALPLGQDGTFKLFVWSHSQVKIL